MTSKHGRSASLGCRVVAMAVSFGVTAPTMGGGAGFDDWNLAIVRVGDGSTVLSSAASPTFVEERSAETGALIGPVLAMPITVSGSHRRLVNTGNLTQEGYLNQSENLTYLMLCGYDAAVGTTNVFATGGSQVNRVIGRVRISTGAIDTTTATADLYSGGSIRSAASDNGTRFWASGVNGSVRYVGSLGGTSSIQLSNSPTNVRVAQLFNGQLYVSSASGSFLGVCTVGSGMPVTNNQTTTLLPGFPTSGTHATVDYFFVADNRVYVADEGTPANGGGIQVWSRVGATWQLTETYSSGPLAAGCRGITGYVDQAYGQVILFVTTAEATNNNIVQVIPPGFKDLNYTVLASAGANAVYRGIRIVTGSCLPPGISGQPQDQVVDVGGIATLTVQPSVIFGTPVRYYWSTPSGLLYDGGNISGSRTATLTINPVQGAGQYFCRIGTPCGSVNSDIASLITCIPPSIVQQPSDQIAVAGGVAQITVAASGFPTPRFEWFRGPNQLINSANISGVDTPTLTFNPVSLNDAADDYRCRVTDNCYCPGPFCVSFTVTSNNASLSVSQCDVPEFDDNPDSISVMEGQPAMFTAHATTQVFPVSYQWLRDNVALVDGGNVFGVATDTLLINPTTLADADNTYQCRARVQCDEGLIEVLSDTAALSVSQVCNSPVIDDQPDPQVVYQSQSVSFTIHATSGFPMAYVWYRGDSPLSDGGNISGTQTPTLTINPVGLRDADNNYRCRVDNNCTPPVFSDPTALTVLPCETPMVTAPESQVVTEGGSATFQVSALGTGPLTYQWRRGLTILNNGGNISGADTPMLTINPVKLSDASFGYRCRVTGLCGVVVSLNASLTVNPFCWADCFPDGGNQVVNIDDLVRVVTNWGICNGHAACPADIYPNGGDGMVNIDDLVRVITNWGICP